MKITSEEWYQLRDDRAKRITGVENADLSNFTLGIMVNPGIINTYEGRVMTLVTMNLVSRWCRKAKINIPEGEVQQNVSQLMSDADPFGNFRFEPFNEDECSIVLVIGEVYTTLNKPFFWIKSDGWLAAYGYSSASTLENKSINLNSNKGCNPVGAAYAACLGIAEIYKQAVGYAEPKFFTKWYSLYDFSTSNSKPIAAQNPVISDSLDLGRVFQIGCGAVGSSLSFLLSLTDWKGNIVLIDHDRIEIPNCISSLSFDAEDAIENRLKVEVCKHVLGDSQITSEIFDDTYGQFLQSQTNNNYPDVILCLANEFNIWSTLQEHYPPVVLHATTTESWGINFGRHIPIKEWCIMCRFYHQIEHIHKPVCAESTIKNVVSTEKTIIGVLPFLSPASAILILAELAKINYNNYKPNKNFVRFNFEPSGTGIFMQEQRLPDKNCPVCGRQYPHIYEDLIQNTKYSKL